MEEAKGLVRHIQSVNDPILERSFRGGLGGAQCLSFDPQMRQLASGGADSIVYVYSFKAQGRPFKFHGHKGSVLSVKFSGDGQTIASGGEDRCVRLWKNSVMEKCTLIKGHVGAVRSLSWSHDNSFIISASDDKTVKGWATPKGKFIFALAGHLNWVRSAVLSPDSRLVVSGSDDSTVRLWDVSTSKELYKFKDFKDRVYSVDWITDGTAICAASNDGKIKLWDARSMRLIQYYDGATKAINSIDVHSSGNYLLSGDDDNNVKIFDLRQGRLAWALYSHKQPVKAVTFNQAGDYFASTGLDQSCLVYKSNFDEQITNCNVAHFADGSLPVQPTFKANNKEYHKENQKIALNEESLIAPVKTNPMAQQLTSKFERIVTQMDTITDMIVRLDKRITQNEQGVKALLNDDHVQGLVSQYDNAPPHQRAAVWEYFAHKQHQLQPQQDEEQQEPVFGTGSFMRDGELEDFPDEEDGSDKKQPEEQFTQTFNVTNNPFQQGALATTLQANNNTLQTLSFTVRQDLTQQLNSLGDWRSQLEQVQREIQQNQQDDENFIREVEGDGEEEEEQGQQGEEAQIQDQGQGAQD